MRWRVLLVAMAVCLGTAGSARATLLGLTKGFPDIASQFLTVEYTAATDVLEIGGPFSTPTLLAYSTILDYDISLGGTFNILADIGPGGVIGPGGGSLLIAGEIPGLALNGNLLTGDLEQFGFLPNGQIFEFVFGVTGGLLASDFGGIGAHTGVILTQIAAFTGNFQVDYLDQTFNAQTDTFLVPEPATAFLVGFALVALTGYARRRLE